MTLPEKKKHIQTLLAHIREYDLESELDFKFEADKVLEAVYNGCGPDWLPGDIRDLLTSHYEFFEPAFLIHDWDFTFLPKNEVKFHRANERLLSNCKRIIECEYRWWNFLSARRRKIQAGIIFEACEEFGFAGFMAALPEKLTEKYNVQM